MKTLTCVVTPDEITREISKSFDYNFDGSGSFVVPTLPSLPSEFGIGLIVGPSGSGKSSLLATLGATPAPIWRNELAVASHFENSQDAIDKLGAVGLNSIPSWMRPYSVLSTGEKFRADVARQLISGATLDEFTSVVDRAVAKSCSHAIRNFVDKRGLRNIVIASCHYDIIEWLLPDWIFDTATMRLSNRGLLQRPKIELEIIPCTSEAWSMFSRHHYLSDTLNKSARCYICVWKGQPVGFSAALAFPNGNFRSAFRESRTVVLPDHQGLGIGVRLSDAVADIFVSQGCRYFSKTSHPRMGQHRETSPLWKPTSKNKKARADYGHGRVTKESNYKHKHIGRVCYSHEYVGCPSWLKPR